MGGLYPGVFQYPIRVDEIENYRQAPQYDHGQGFQYPIRVDEIENAFSGQPQLAYI